MSFTFMFMVRVPDSEPVCVGDNTFINAWMQLQLFMRYLVGTLPNNRDYRIPVEFVYNPDLLN